MSNLIKLSNDLIIGEGRDRICYEHPKIKNLCIKISKTTDKQSKREVRYFRFLKSTSTDLSKISLFFGKVKTNYGTGYLFELIRDDDGKISKTLGQCLKSNEFTLMEIQPKLLKLKNYLIANKICVRDISPSNISCRKSGTGFKLFIIDGVSNASTNPLTVRLQGLVNEAIDKAWESLERKLNLIETSLNKG